MTDLVRHQMDEDFKSGNWKNIQFTKKGQHTVITVNSGEDGYYTSKPIKAKFPFNYFAVQWKNDSANKSAARKLMKVEVRSSVDGKTWSAWETADPDEFSHPDMEHIYSDLIYAKKSNYVQYRVELDGDGKVTPRVKDIRIFFVNSVDGEKVTKNKSLLDVLFDDANAAVNKPNVVSREQWGADESLRYDSNGNETWPREYTNVTHMVVHHTNTINNDPNPMATLRAIYAYHAKPVSQGGRGWGDIAYNALIGPDGTIYEGRKGKDGEAMSEGVVGAHAYSFNKGTVGVSVLGNFDEVQLNNAQHQSLVNLLAYHASYWNIDPTAKKDFVRNYEYSDPSVPKVDYNLPTLTGHGLLPRASTSCPGASIKNELTSGRLQADVKAAMQSGETDNVKRLAGANRYDVAVNVSKEINSLGFSSDTVIIARDDLYTDALSGGPLAGKSNSPILLTATSSLPTPIQQEILRRNPTKAIILGGTGSVSTTVETQLKNLGVSEVQRIDGPNRFAVSANVAEQVVSGGTKTKAVIASGLNFPDALSVSGVAGKEGMPILLVSTSSIPAEIQTFINNHPEITDYIIVGGPGTVSDTVKAQLEQSGKTVTRIGGANRFEVGVNIANYFHLTPATTVFARGDDFADALSGGPLAASTGAPIFLTPTTRLATEVENYLQANVDQLEKAYIIGGTGSVSTSVEVKIASYVNQQ